MDRPAVDDGNKLPILERSSLCLPSQKPGVSTQCGEDGFVQNLARHFPSEENNALELLVLLKEKLKNADTDAFWTMLMEGMTDICHAQYGFVAKRVLSDDHNSAVEMPPIGDMGSCLLGVAFYYNDGHKQKGMHHDYKYLAWGAPCAYMKHDKVFLVPENMSTFITHNPNALPFPAEAYIGVPLFHEGKCFAHFGMMWSDQGVKQRDISWGFTEMLLHSLEDMIVQRLIEGKGFAKPRANHTTLTSSVIPQEAVTPATQSLKPFAKSLSHELRTPMQGVVGMLDVMHATVQDQIEGSTNSPIRQVFQSLKDNIEIVQDSSKRAVEAADNVVHAYDMNMQIPDTPLNENESPANANTQQGYFDFQPARVIEGSDIHVSSYKRRRSSPNEWSFGNATKLRNLGQPTRYDVSPKSGASKFAPVPSVTPLTSSDDPLPTIFTPAQEAMSPSSGATTPSNKAGVDLDPLPTPGLKICRIRELVPSVIHDSLRVGGRPDSANADPTDTGEQITVRSRSSNGHVSQKTILWSVAHDVPETLMIDERDLGKLVSAVFLNALKFTEEGLITLSARLSRNLRCLVVNIKDTGDGIPEDFQPELFKPFSREDDSLTRSKEGLGLGLLVAKGLARRLGGDINLVRTETTGQNKGSEFEIKIPLEPADSLSRTGTPRSRTPEVSQHLAIPSTLSAPPTSNPASTNGSVTPTPAPDAQFSSPEREPPERPSAIRRLSELGPIPTDPRRNSIPLAAPPKLSTAAMFDKNLAAKYPLTFLVAEDNKINRKLLVNMLGKLGYKDVHEAFDGKEAVRVFTEIHETVKRGSGGGYARSRNKVDVILMDLWMPEMDGYQATETILSMFQMDSPDDRDIPAFSPDAPVVLAVSADVTEEAIRRATRTGMEGFMTKPYKLMDLQRLITEFCVRQATAAG